MSSRALALVLAVMATSAGTSGCAHERAGGGSGLPQTRAELRARANALTGWPLQFREFSVDIVGTSPAVKGVPLRAAVSWMSCYMFVPAAVGTEVPSGYAFALHLEGELPEPAESAVTVYADVNHSGDCDEGEPVWHVRTDGLRRRERILLGEPTSMQCNGWIRDQGR